MSPALRRLSLVLHVTTSVDWLGTVAAFLALAANGLVSESPQVVRAMYLGMEVATWWMIGPLAGASLATGLVMSLGTAWGLFRHYRVIAKLLLSFAATGLLLLHTGPIGLVARVAAGRTLQGDEPHDVRVQLVLDAGAAIVVLLAATVLSIYKPKGVTPYGWRQLLDERAVTLDPTAR